MFSLNFLLGAPYQQCQQLFDASGYTMFSDFISEIM